jgi:hypothetical protein
MRRDLYRAELAGVRLQVIRQGHQQRAAVESMIRDHYARRYDASLTGSMPDLLTLISGNGELLAAIGVRSAAVGPLLLERYFDRPVEQLLESRSGRQVTRSRVVELGNLAVADPLCARWMVVAVNAYLKGAGFDWVTFTLIPSLYNTFRRLGLALLYLADADGERLGEGRHEWGRYYDLQPQVYAGDVDYGYRVLKRLNRGSERMLLLDELWSYALAAGRFEPLMEACA